MESPGHSSQRVRRRDAIMAAAVSVLAERGPRGFTHRAVDAAVGLGPGAVNYHAPSRARLLSLAIEEVFRRDFETAARHFDIDDWSHDNVVRALVGFVTEMTSDANRERIVARHHLRGEAQTNDELREAFDHQQSSFVRLARTGFEAAGRDAGDATAELFRLTIDGLLNRQVMCGTASLTHEQLVEIADLIVPT